ncbi:hypothetical protein D3C80_2100710 [compost metagenome]
MLEADFTGFVHRDQVFVGFQRGATGWQAKDERAICGRFEGVDTLNDMACGPFADLSSVL